MKINVPVTYPKTSSIVKVTKRINYSYYLLELFDFSIKVAIGVAIIRCIYPYMKG